MGIILAQPGCPAFVNNLQCAITIMIQMIELIKKNEKINAIPRPETTASNGSIVVNL